MAMSFDEAMAEGEAALAQLRGDAGANNAGDVPATDEQQAGESLSGLLGTGTDSPQSLEDVLAELREARERAERAEKRYADAQRGVSQAFSERDEERRRRAEEERARVELAAKVAEFEARQKADQIARELDIDSAPEWEPLHASLDEDSLKSLQSLLKKQRIAVELKQREMQESIQRKIQEQEQREALAQQAAHLKRIKDAHQDLDVIQSSDEFRHWREAHPEFEPALQYGNADAVIRTLQRFKDETQTTGKKTGTQAAHSADADRQATSPRLPHRPQVPQTGREIISRDMLSQIDPRNADQNTIELLQRMMAEGRIQ